MNRRGFIKTTIFSLLSILSGRFVSKESITSVLCPELWTPANIEELTYWGMATGEGWVVWNRALNKFEVDVVNDWMTTQYLEKTK